MSADRQHLLRAALDATVTRTTANGDGTMTIPGEAWATLVGTIVMATNGDNDGQVPMGVAPDPAPLDVERLADAFTWFHVRHDGICAESHRREAREYAALASEDRP
mgnify:CR=1 FL=1